LTDKLEIPYGIGLVDFLSKELQASTMNVRGVSKNELFVESDPIVRIHIIIDEKRKQINFDIFSPRWGRRITVQQLGGFEFMESQAEDLLFKENSDAIAEDSLLALDIVRLWAGKNGYEATEVASLPEAPLHSDERAGSFTGRKKRAPNND
jgi:hypothetical protein